MNTATLIHKKVAALSVEHSAEAAALRAFGALLALLIVAYVYFVSMSILNVMARREALAQASTLQSQTAELEQRYFSLSEAMTPEAAGSLGLAPVEETAYVYRPGAVGLADASNNAI